MSNISFTANLTKDPVTAYTKDNTPVCNLSLAENRRYQKPDGEWTSDVVYYDASVWRDQATYVADSLHKGDRVVVIGRMEFREWDDNGKRRTKHEVRIFSIGASMEFARVDVKKVAREETPAPNQEEPVAPTGTDDVI